MDGKGQLGISYAHLVSYKEKGFTFLPDEVQRALKETKARLAKRKIIFVCDLGFDDSKVFKTILSYKEAFVIFVYHDRYLEIVRPLQ